MPELTVNGRKLDSARTTAAPARRDPFPIPAPALVLAGTRRGLGAGKGSLVFQSTTSGGSWSAVTTGLSTLAVRALAIDPSTPSTLYAGTNGGVFSTGSALASSTPTGTPINTPTQTPAATVTPIGCVGDCSGDGQVTVNELIIMVNIALGTAQSSACPHGIPSGVEVDITLIIKAVGYALTSCPAPTAEA